MYKSTVTRNAIKALNTARPAFAAAHPATGFTRSFSYTAPLGKKKSDGSTKDPILSATTKAPEGASGEKEGQFARTDESVHIEYPPDSEMPTQPVAQGRGGMHFKRTLAQFSLENKVSVVTGGARGLGLVMGQGLVASGSDLAIIDLNSMLLQSPLITETNNLFNIYPRGRSRVCGCFVDRAVPQGESRSGRVSLHCHTFPSRRTG